MGRFLNADGLVSTGGLLGNNMFAYCGNNPSNAVDPAGEIPKELGFCAACTYGGGTSCGPYIPIPISYDDIPYDEDSLERWADEHGYTDELQLMDAISDINDGVDYVKEGAGLILVPYPTVADDLCGVAVATYGVLKATGGFAEFIIWVFRQSIEK